MFENSLVKGLVIIVAGGVAIKAIKEVRQRKLEKDMYEQCIEVAEEVVDEQQNRK